MKTSFKTMLGAAMLPILFAVPAAAQATRTWVSGVGDDVNPCSRTAPCKTFAGAISKTAAGGQINTLDPGAYGTVTITKAITIAAEGSGEGGILATGTNGININAGANDAVILRGLQIDGGPISSSGLSGVKFNTGGSLTIQNSIINNFTNVGAGYGVWFAPQANSSLFISDTTIANNGSGSTGGGVFIAPAAGGSAKATLIRVNAVNNVFGIRADGTNTTQPVTVSVSDSSVGGSGFGGLTAFSPVGGPFVTMTVTNTVSSNNGTGLNANGLSAKMRVGYSTITLNGTGATISNSATITSLGNNMISDNTNPGAFLPVQGPQ